MEDEIVDANLNDRRLSPIPVADKVEEKQLTRENVYRKTDLSLVHT